LAVSQVVRFPVGVSPEQIDLLFNYRKILTMMIAANALTMGFFSEKDEPPVRVSPGGFPGCCKHDWALRPTPLLRVLG